MSQFDKFKRRLIRSVARLMATEEPAAMWETLEKETGRDCKTIWEHMRALTLRKLTRLLAADDQVEKVGSVARMTPVDWLQFDMVLVHEDIDVLDLGKGSKKTLCQLSATWDLLKLVKQYHLNNTSPERMAELWASITVHYNRSGRECSPMLLQKRWHQLQKQTRARFYVFWYEYKGVESRLEQAKRSRPSTLEFAIAKCFPCLITSPLPSWKNAIEDGNVVLMEDIHNLMRNKQKDKIVEEGPELELMEKEIETIDLACDSDNNDKKDNKDESIKEVEANEPLVKPTNEEITNAEMPNEATVIIQPKIKQELQEDYETLDLSDTDGLSNVKITSAAHITTAEIVESDVAQLDLIDKEPDVVIIDENTFIKEEPELTQEIKDDSDEPQNDILERPESEPDCYQSAETDLNRKAHINNTEPKGYLNRINEVNPPDKTQTVEEGNISEKTKMEVEQICNSIDLDVPLPIAIKTGDALNLVPDTEDFIDHKMDIDCEKDKNSKPITDSIEIDTNNTRINEVNEVEQDYEEDIIMYDPSTEVDKDTETIVDINTNLLSQPFKDTIEPKTYVGAEDGVFEIVDEGIDDGEYLTEHQEHVDASNTDPDTSLEASVKLDLKLIMAAIVYTTKLDDMKSLLNQPFEHVKTSPLIENVLEESKPKHENQIGVSYLTNSDTNKSSVENNCETSENGPLNCFQTVPTLNEDNVARDIKMEIDLSPDQVDIGESCHSDLDANNKKGTFKTLRTEHGSDFSHLNKNNEDGLLYIHIKKESEGIVENEEDQYSSEDEYENLRISPLSKLFRKPSECNYNPVQLCKNPDFNTRLKRIPILFYTYDQNKIYLNECKPLTIDLDKRFETKMYNNTVYLKRDPNAVRIKDQKINRDIQQNINTECKIDNTDTHIAMSLPVESIKSEKEDAETKTCPTYALKDEKHAISSNSEIDDEALITERKRKTVNLHDIIKVRRLNQHLLTAEVAPIFSDTKVEDRYETKLDSEKETVNLKESKTVFKTKEYPHQQQPQPLNKSDIKGKKLNESNSERHHFKRGSQTPWYLSERYTSHSYLRGKKRTVNNTKPVSEENWHKKINEIYGENNLARDSVLKMLMILEKDAIVDERLTQLLGNDPRSPLPKSIIKAANKGKGKGRKREHRESTETQTSKKEVQSAPKPPIIRIVQGTNTPQQNLKALNGIDAKKTRNQEAIKVPNEEVNVKETRNVDLSLQKPFQLDSNETVRDKQVPDSDVDSLRNIENSNYKSIATMNLDNKSKSQTTTPKTVGLTKTPIQIHNYPASSSEQFISPYIETVSHSFPKITVYQDHTNRRKTIHRKILTKSRVITRTHGIPRGRRPFRNTTVQGFQQIPTVKQPVPISRDDVKLNICEEDVVLSRNFLSMFPDDSAFGMDKVILTSADLSPFRIKIPVAVPTPTIVEQPPRIPDTDFQEILPPFSVPDGIKFYLTKTGEVIGTISATITDPEVVNSVQNYVDTIKQMLITADTSHVGLTQTESLPYAATVPPAIQLATPINTCNLPGTSKISTNTNHVEASADVNVEIFKQSETVENTNNETSINEPVQVNDKIPDEGQNLQTICQQDLQDTNITIAASNIALEETHSPIPETENESATSKLITETINLTDDSAYVSEPNNTRELTTAENVPKDNNTSQKKSILSDLMAMTGITSDDILSSEPDKPQFVPVAPKITVEDTILHQNLNLEKESNNPFMKILTPVTSFEMLKYANEKNGEFYKLDLKSGLILPINVGFKKVRAYAQKQSIKTVAVSMQSTIDLTEDQDNLGESTVISDDDDFENDLPCTFVVNVDRNRKQTLQCRNIEPSHKDGEIISASLNEKDPNNDCKNREEDGSCPTSDESSSDDEPLSKIAERLHKKENDATKISSKKVVNITKARLMDLESDLDLQTDDIASDSKDDGSSADDVSCDSDFILGV